MQNSVALSCYRNCSIIGIVFKNSQFCFIFKTSKTFWLLLCIGPQHHFLSKTTASHLPSSRLQLISQWNICGVRNIVADTCLLLCCSLVTKSCPNLLGPHGLVQIFWDPMDYSPSDSSVSGIIQAKYCSVLPFLTPGDLPNPGIEQCLLRCRQILYHCVT